MNKILLSAALLLVFCFSITAGNPPDDENTDIMAEITLNDGTKFEAVIRLPSLEDKTIRYIDPVSRQQQKLQSSDIRSMLVWRNPHRNVTYQFIYTRIRSYGLTWKKNEISKKARWIMLMASREHIRMYQSGEEYHIRIKDGELRMLNSGTDGLTVRTYYLQRNNEEIPTNVGHIYTAYDLMKTAGKRYFSDSPEMLKLVNDKTWKKKNLFDIILYYEKTLVGK